MLRDSAEIYRCWSAQYVGEYDRDVAGEHQRILDAALRRDADEATTALSEHIELTTEILLKSYADRVGVSGAPLPD
jgi:DNA-binding GntR family transcriptional regulator